MKTVLRLIVAMLAVVGADQKFDSKLAAQEKTSFLRRDEGSEEELRQQLQIIPEVGFDQTAAAIVQQYLRNGTQVRGGANGSPPLPDLGFRYYEQLARQHHRDDVLALPWRKDVECQTGRESAEWLQSCSVNLRTCLQRAGASRDPGLATAASLKVLLRSESQVGQAPNLWGKPACVPTLVQMLQAENASVREVLIETLARIDGKEASVALAQRAVFDLSPQVRQLAVEALQSRPLKDFQQVLTDALRWPWKPAADHAAEAIVALELKELTPELLAILNEPDPVLPFTKKVNGTERTFVKELVRLNHFQNCLLCHAPSISSQDLVRGLIPTPGQTPAPEYYAARTGQFVRADTTFLRQDFSVVQPVANPGTWPVHQRFDYVLRERRANAAELKHLQALQKARKTNASYAQREAVMFALREIRE
jgi:hypothetical protein